MELVSSESVEVLVMEDIENDVVGGGLPRLLKMTFGVVVGGALPSDRL